MQVSEQFAKVLRVLLVAVLVITAAVMLEICWKPVHAQNNAGVVGIQSVSIPVFTAQAANGSSTIFQDIGQGVNILRYCDTGFTGTIDLEWRPLNTSTFQTLASATYAGLTSLDNGCHTLTVNGYWPNLRSSVSGYSAGTISAWYSSSSGPVGFAAPAIASTGPVSPVQCDNFNNVSVAPSSVAVMVLGSPGQTIYLCGATVTFGGATTAGLLEIGRSATGAGCPSFVGMYNLSVQTNTPQLFTLGSGLGSFFQLGEGAQLCASATTIGSTANIAFSWTQLAQ